MRAPLDSAEIDSTSRVMDESQKRSGKVNEHLQGIHMNADGSLVVDPFSDESIQGLFFPGGDRAETLDQLLHLLRYGPPLVVLHGENGVGKHFLVDHLVSQLDLDMFDLAMIQADDATVSTFITELAEAWHIRQAMSLQDVPGGVVQAATLADEEARILLCVVRRAQNLDQSECHLLSEILGASVGLPVKFLLLLDAINLDESNTMQPFLDSVPDYFEKELLPFSRTDAKDYLAYRLRTAGVRQWRFSQQHAEHIYQQSAGNAQKINDIAGDMLSSSLSSLPIRPEWLKSLPWMHASALGVVIVLLAFLFSSGDDEDNAENTAKRTIPLGKPNAVAPSAPEVKPLQVDSSSLTSSSPVRAPVSESASAESGRIKGSPSHSIEHSLSENNPEEQADRREVIEKWGESGQAGSVGEKKAVTSGKSVDERAAWILSLPPSHYTLQLLGAKEKSTVERFLARYPSIQNVAYYRTTRKGASWFVVVQGSYPDQASARAAVKKLPEALQKQSPWPRKVVLIQQELKK